MRLRKLIQCAIAGLALSITGAAAETPKDTLVVADAIDDVITLDPGEVSEIGGRPDHEPGLSATGRI
jgi:peptide/nickel transport system substrate-binding protein